MSRQAPAPISAALLKSEKNRAAPVTRATTKDWTALTYRAPNQTYERLRTVAFHRRLPIQALIDEAVEQWLDRNAS